MLCIILVEGSDPLMNRVQRVQRSEPKYDAMKKTNIEKRCKLLFIGEKRLGGLFLRSNR